MEKNSEILNIKELSYWLHISTSMIRKLIYENKIPTFRIGNRYYFVRNIIKQWIINRHKETYIGGIENEIR